MDCFVKTKRPPKKEGFRATGGKKNQLENITIGRAFWDGKKKEFGGVGFAAKRGNTGEIFIIDGRQGKEYPRKKANKRGEKPCKDTRWKNLRWRGTASKEGGKAGFTPGGGWRLKTRRSELWEREVHCWGGRNGGLLLRVDHKWAKP